MARIALRDKSRKHNGTDVDHVVAYALWREKLEQGKEAGDLTEEQLSEVEPAVNQLGNCLLLDKNFNISKSAQPLNEFLGKVYEFKQGKLQIADWASAMDLEMAQVDSTASPLATLHKLFEERAQKIRAELTDFIRGSRSRVDLEDAEHLTAVAVATVGTLEQITVPRGGRDPVRIAFIKSLKQRFSHPPLADKFRCWGHKGRSYSCFFSFADQGEIYFGLDWDNPFLSVPKNAGYDTDALVDEVWQPDGEDARWHDFGPTDLTDPQLCQVLLDRVADLLGTIALQEPTS